MSNINQKIFKAYDVRGIYPDDFNEDMAYAIGQALVRFLENKGRLGQRKIIVGRDMRLSAEDIFEAFTDGILSQGADVIDIGLSSTPFFYWAMIKEGADAGAEITASHNPAQYNGLKICGREAAPIALDSGLSEIAALAGKSYPVSTAPGKMISKNLTDGYIDFVAGLFDLAAIKPFKVVIDCGNGIVGPEAKKIFSRLSCKVEYLYDEPDGAFPNHEANPIKDENVQALKKRILASGADLGIAFDGDADRVVFMDETGEMVRGDFTTALLAQELLGENQGQKILYEVRSSKIVPETVKNAGGEAILGRPGHSLMKEQMRQEDILFGGELSGHYFYRDLGIIENTFFTALKMLEILSESGKKMSELLVPLKKYYHSGEINFKVADPDKTIAIVAESFGDGRIKRIDGITVEYADWWFNLRKSNTEPLVRLNMEADTPEKLEEKKKELVEIIK